MSYIIGKTGDDDHIEYCISPTEWADDESDESIIKFSSPMEAANYIYDDIYLVAIKGDSFFIKEVMYEKNH